MEARTPGGLADTLRGALRGAAAFLPGSAFPAPGMSSADLLASAQAVAGELKRRADADAAAVRSPLGRFRQLSLYTNALGTARPGTSVMQLPLLPGEIWVGLPLGDANSIENTGSGCAKQTGTFEDDLPCEGNAVLRPYGAVLLGGTINTGNSALGVLTVGLTAGWARTTQDATAFRFWGLMVGTGAVYVPVPLVKDAS